MKQQSSVSKHFDILLKLASQRILNISILQYENKHCTVIHHLVHVTWQSDFLK